MSAPAAAAEPTAGRALLTLPAATPYERQVLVQSIQRAVARWGAASVAVGQREVLVVSTRAGRETLCALCRRDIGPVRCRAEGPHRCLGCALEATLPDGCAAATIAANAIAPVGAHAERPPHSGDHSRRAAASRPSIAQRRQ